MVYIIDVTIEELKKYMCEQYLKIIIIVLYKTV